MGIEILLDSQLDMASKRLPVVGHLKGARLEAKDVPHQIGVAQSQPEGGDSTCTSSQNRHIIQPQAADQVSGVVGMANRIRRPSIPSASPGAPTVISNNPATRCQTISDTPLELGVLIGSTDQQHRRTRTPLLDVQDRASD